MIPDNLFGIHTKALDVWQRRSEVLANNLANTDTPDFKARDVDFAKVLAAASGSTDASQLALNVPSAGQIGSATQIAIRSPTFVRRKIVTVKRENPSSR